MRFRMHARHDDVTALDMPHEGGGRFRAHAVEHVLHPRAAGVDDRACADVLDRTFLRLQSRTPKPAFALR